MSAETCLTQNQPPSPDSKSPWSNIRQRLASCAVALTLAASAAGGCYSGDGIFNEVGGVVTLDEAPSPDVAALQKVREIVARHDDPEIRKLNVEKEDQEVDYAIERAKKRGLHLVDYRPYATRLSQSQDLDSSQRVFKDFMGQYGFKADIFGGIATDWRNFPSRPLEKKPELKPRLDNAIQSLMRDMSPVPIELARATSVKEVAIQSSVSSFSGRASGGLWDTLHKRALLSMDDLDTTGAENAPVHEIVGHGIFGTFMESYNDPEGRLILKEIRKTVAREDWNGGSHVDGYGRTSIRELQAVTMERIILGDLRDDRAPEQKMILLTLARVAGLPKLGGFPDYIRDVSKLEQ